MRTVVRFLIVLLVVIPLSLLAGDEKTAKQQADEKAAMEAWIKASTPGDLHKQLAAMEGAWNATVRMWNAPGAPPEETAGTSWNKMILGGRWLEQRFESTMMGQKFDGVGYTGYDNIRKQFVGSWMDSMSTGMMLSTGKAGKAANTWEFEGTMDDPLTGKPSKLLEVLTVADPDHHKFEMFGFAPDGAKFKMMEIEYARKK